MLRRIINKIGKQLLGNSLWLLVDKVVRLFVGLFVGVLVARYLGPDGMGLWNYCLAFFAFFSVFPSLGLEYISPREFVNQQGKESGLLNTVFILKFFGSSIGLIAAVLTLGYLKGFDDQVVLLVFILTTGYVFQSFDVIDYYFQSKLLQKRSVIAKMFAFLIVAAYKFYLIQSGAPLIWFVASSTIEFLIAGIGLWFALKNTKIKINLRLFDWKIAKELLKDSLPFSASALLVLIFYKVDQVMITEILGEEENGIYSVAVRIYELFMFLPAILVGSFLPIITKNFKLSEKDFRASLKQLYTILTYFAIISSLGAWLLGPTIMHFLYGEEFEGSGAALQIIGLGFYPVFLGIATSNYLIVRNYKLLNLVRSAIGLIVNVLLNLLLIPKIGIIGAAWASVISNFISTLCILFVKDNHQHWKLFLSPFNLNSIQRFIKY